MERVTKELEIHPDLDEGGCYIMRWNKAGRNTGISKNYPNYQLAKKAIKDQKIKWEWEVQDEAQTR